VELVSGTAVWLTQGQAPLPLRWVLIRDPQGTFLPQAFFATAVEVLPAQINAWFVLRWSAEVAFAEVRAHLGVETQRQLAELAIARETPALLGVFSVITLLRQHLTAGQAHPVRTAAWYVKRKATFADTLAPDEMVEWCAPARPRRCGAGGSSSSRETAHALAPACRLAPHSANAGSLARADCRRAALRAACRRAPGGPPRSTAGHGTSAGSSRGAPCIGRTARPSTRARIAR
jgi:hypothetical protein